MVSLSILVVDDDTTIRGTISEFFEALGHTVRNASTATEGRRAAAEHSPDIAIVDLHLPDADGLRLLEALRADDPELGVIFLTGHANVPTAVRAMREGAVDFLEKPVDLEVLAVAVHRAAEHARLRREIVVLRARDTEAVATPLPVSSGIERMIELAARHDDAPILILGETGTGKGFIARRIHEKSPRRNAPFVEINCASLSTTFFESELFGHERGAFTDARHAKRGLFEVAARGTVFLDEIAEMGLEVQPKLLKVIEEGSYRRLGGTTSLRSEARLIVATNQPLAAAVADKRFRADLFYRLQVLAVHLPPLRERPGDILPLAQALLPRGARLSEEARRALTGYPWPGNVRELKNALWRSSILTEDGEIRSSHLGLGAESSPALEDLSLQTAERRAIERALHATGGNKLRAAAILGIARSTLNEKLRVYRLSDDDSLGQLQVM